MMGIDVGKEIVVFLFVVALSLLFVLPYLLVVLPYSLLLWIVVSSFVSSLPSSLR